jgi:hypothetical protein
MTQEHSIMANLSDLKDPAVHGNVKRIVLNQFWADSRFIGVLAASIQRTSDVDEKMQIVEHMEATRTQMADFRRVAVEVLGINWEAEDHSQFGFRVLTKRYDWLRENTDPVELLVGLYLFAHGVIGHTEFTELHRCSPEIFPGYDSFAREVDRQCAEGSARLRRMLDDDPGLREHAAGIARKYGGVLMETTEDSSFSQFLAQLAEHGLLPADIGERAGKRYMEVFSFLINPA